MDPKLAFVAAPVPPIGSKGSETRRFRIHGNDPFDEEFVPGWIRQAATLPGRVP